MRNERLIPPMLHRTNSKEGGTFAAPFFARIPNDIAYRD
jgi:hypothetical protein